MTLNQNIEYKFDRGESFIYYFKMEVQTNSTQICRLCLENENDGFLVEIFSSMINEPGKMSLSEKIRALFGLKVSDTFW